MSKSILFSSSSLGIVVSLEADGSSSLSGRYNGVAIKSAVPFDGGKRCILLVDPDANRRPVFENLICVDEDGNAVWSAKLPTSPDTFVGIDSTPEGVWAHTWSGLKVLIDRGSGAELKRVFVK